MNQLQPSVNWSTVSQRMDDRRTAATNYRLARLSEDQSRVHRLTAWRVAFGRRVTAVRDAIGHRLIALGEKVSVHRPKSLSRA